MTAQSVVLTTKCDCTLNNLMSKKTMLVQFGSFTRKVEFEIPLETDKITEREALLKEIKVNFKERICIEDKVTLQMKDEDWGGVFVDFFAETGWPG